MAQEDIQKLGAGSPEENPIETDATPEHGELSRDVATVSPPMGIGSTADVRMRESLNMPVKVPNRIALSDRYDNKVLSGLLRGGNPEENFKLAIALDRGKLKWAHQIHFGSSVEEANLFARIAAEKKIPLDLAKESKETYKRAQEQLKLYQTLTATDPKTGAPKYKELYSWITNPAQMAVGKYYVKTLANLNTLYKEHYGMSAWEKYKEADKEFAGVLKRHVQRFKSGGAGTIQALAQAAKLAITLYDPKDHNLRKIYDDIDKFQQGDWLKQYSPEAQGKIEKVIGDMINSLPGTVTGMLMSGIGAGIGATAGSTAGTAAGLASPIPGGAILGGIAGGVAGGFAGGLIGFLPIAAGSLSIDLEKVKGLTNEQKAYISIGGGLFTSLAEKIGLDSILSGGYTKFIKFGSEKGIVKLLTAMAGEGATEGLQEYIEEITVKYGVSLGEGKGDVTDTLKRVDWTETKGRALYSGFIGALMGGFMKGSAQVVQGTKHMLDRQAEQEIRQDAHNKLKKLVNETDMKDKAPEQLEGVINHLAKQTGGETDVYVPVSKVEEFYAQDPKQGFSELREVKDFLERNGVSEEAFQKAKDTGGYVKVNKGKYLTQNKDTKLLDHLDDHIRLSENGASAAEIAKAKKEIAENKKTIEQTRNALKQKAPEELTAHPKLQELRNIIMKPKSEGGLGIDARSADGVVSVWTSRAMVAESTYKDTTATQWLDTNVPDVKRVDITKGDTAPTGKDLLYTFGSTQAKTADVSALFDTAARIKAGETPENVRRDTGWFRPDDKRWRFEIDDSLAVIKKTKFDLDVKNKRLIDIAKPLDEVLGHPKLFNAYPALRDVKVYMVPDLEAAADYSPGRRIIRLRGRTPFVTQKQKTDLLHEVQHAVQEIERFAKGTSVRGAMKALKKRRGRNAKITDLQAKLYYAGAHGEIEARNVEARAKLSESERKKIPPFESTEFGFRKWAESQGVDNAPIEVFFQEGDIKEGDQPRAAIDLKDNILYLFEKADFSSILHESTHRFLKDMEDAVASGQANEQVQKDLETLKEFAGGKFDRNGQEKIARASEIYFREGKAPSRKLVNAFDTFKQWLLNIYKTIKELNVVDMNDDVRQVFDRMLATPQEIEDVRLLYESASQLEDILKAEAAQKQKIRELRDKADTDSVRSRAAKMVNAHLRATDGRKQLRAQAKAHVESMPEYKHLDTVSKKGGVNPDSLAEHLNVDGVAALRKQHGSKFIPKTSQGISVPEAAIEGGYASVEEYIAYLQNLPKKSTAITRRTDVLVDQLRTQFENQLKADEAIAGETDYHNDTRLKMLQAEEQLILEQVDTLERNRLESIAKQAYKIAAEKHLYGERVDVATRWQTYARAQQKYSREAIEAAEKGDFVASHEAKTKQILNHILVQEAIKIRDYVRKVESKYASRKIKKKLNAIDPQLADIASDLIHHYRLNSSTMPKDPRARLELGAIDEGLEIHTPEWLIDKRLPEGENGAGYKSLTYRQLQDLDETIGRIVGFGKEQMQAFESEERQTFENVKAEILENLKKIKDAASSQYDKDGIPHILRVSDGLASEYSRNQFIFERLDGWIFRETGRHGALGELDYNGGVVAEANFQKIQEKVFKELEPHMDYMLKQLVAIEKRNGGKNFNIEGLPVTPEMEDAGLRTWTADRLFAVALNMGNSGNVAALKEGNGFTDRDLQIIANQFDSKAWDAIQGVWDTIGGLWGQVNETNKAMYGVGIGKVDPDGFQVTTSDGVVKEMRGGYYTRAYDPKTSDKFTKHMDEKQVEDFFRTQQAMFIPRVKEDFVKARSKKTHGALLLDPALLYRHVLDTSRFISHGRYIKDMRRILFDKDLSREIRKKTGDKVFKEIVESMKYQARAERQFHDIQSGWLERHRRKATPIILGGSAAVPLKQRGSLINGISEIGWLGVADGILSMKRVFVTGMPVGEAFRKLEANSPFLQAKNKNTSEAQKEVRDSVLRKWKRRKITIFGKTFSMANVVDLNFLLIRAQDRATTDPFMLGAYNQYMRRNQQEAFDIRHKNAVIYSDTVGRKTQPSVLPADLNKLQRNQNGAIRLFVVFMAYRMVHANRLIYNTKAMMDGAIPFNKWARMQFGEQYVMGMMMSMIGSLVGSGEMPDWFELFVLGPVSNLIGPIPLAGILTTAAHSAIIKGEGVRAVDRATRTTAFEGVRRYMKAGKATVDYFSDDKEFSEVILDYGKLLEYQTNVAPLTFGMNVKRVLDNIEEVE